MIKRFLSIILLAAGLQAGWGFALLGPNAQTLSGFTGNAWQTIVIGYNNAIYQENDTIPGGPVALGDIGGPVNIGEGYRRNVPTIYYAYNANFSGFFGSNGMSSVDGAFAIMNSLTNVSSYSSDLSEFPLTSQHFNYQAQALFLTDVKSVTLHLLVETMGLTDPERFTWTLAERVVPPGCPLTTLYLVIQRNFDIIPSALNQIQYSSYVNNELFTYYIYEVCAGNPTLAIAAPVPVDPLQAEDYTAVAANNFTGIIDEFVAGGEVAGLEIGGYYTGLTRDDVGGLRYLMSAANIATEDAGAGSLLQVTNLSPQQLITTLPLGLFLSQALTNDPVTLQTLYPGLIISSTITNYFFANSTNVTAYYTNQPGPSVTNYSPALVLLTNNDFSLFQSLSKTDAPAVLQGLYPNLLILNSAITGLITFSNPIVTVYLTNQIGAPFGSPPIVVTVTNGYTFNYVPTYTYSFGNIVTNFYSKSNLVTIQNITVTNLIGAPVGSPQSTNVTSVNKYLTNSYSGDFFIIPTNWCGYSILATGSVQRIPSYTNVLAANATTNSFGVAQFSQNTIYFYTNRVYGVFPGVCEPALVFATNVVPTVGTNYLDSFANLQTLSSNNTTLTTLIITNIGACSNGIDGTLCTNVFTTNFLANVISGDFFIVPAAWNCGYTIISTQSVMQVGVTNTTTTVPTNVTSIGQQYSVTTISYYTNRLLIIQPIICQLAQPGPALREGIERIQFVRANYDSIIGQFFQPITNMYSMVKVTNSQAITEYYQRIITRPDIVLSADDQIAANTFNGTVTRNIVYDTANVLPGLAGPGVINSPVTFSYNKIGDAFENGSLSDFLFTTNQFLNELTATPVLAWASFDSSTNLPVVYPNGNSIQNLQNQILVQISPTSLANGTNNTVYPSVTFTATGGSFIPPFTWSAAGLPPGMTVSSGGTLSGTPTQTGTFDITLQLTDSLSRTVQWFYTLIIQ